MILRRADVELDKRFDVAVMHPANLQVRNLTIHRTNSTGLEPHAIETAMLRPSLSEPFG
jgi:hypothetical protein